MTDRAAAATAAGLSALPATPALAHHPMGGDTPETWWQGLLSGFGHPAIEPVHFVFIVLLALLCLAARKPAIPAGAFVVGTALGALAHWVEAPVPGGALLAAATVVLAGIALAAGLSRDRPDVLGALFLVAGTFHGHGYGETIVGAEPTPVGFYLAGFAVTQLALVLAIQVAARWLGRQRPVLLERGTVAVGALGAVAGAGFMLQAGLAA